ncbi:DUF1849 family protein [Aurantimonas sp. 22II-16-19i]|uniref:EipB family protein n=1 Tax=Aurantimonas sp. 22II-16-19i TaxID=1317114 RepID=UPI0009F7CB80|nr:DUF1849 family protein [Aurantimonas sp. 22II-16-19i]ORE98096.1 hypothetical protein ATO4_05864 [Aurantimonas sp. 22II-16-19i]
MTPRAVFLPVLASGLLAAAAGLAPGSAGAAEPVRLAPHRAAYDVGLDQASEQLLGVDGKIAVALNETGDCAGYGIDYRFVARFIKDQEIVVTDQQVRLSESRDARSFGFDAESFIDSQPDTTTKGTATISEDATVVAYDEPEAREVTLPRSTFPVQHTREIIAAAKAGVPIIESPVFQGDADAEKHTTSTVIVMPLGKDALAQEIAGYGARPGQAADEALPTGSDGPESDGSEAVTPEAGEREADAPASDAPDGDAAAAAPQDRAGGRADDGSEGKRADDAKIAESQDPAASAPEAIAARLAGLAAWRISESFYNSDSNENGLPVFETIYTLFENGVTGNQILKFDGYALKTRLVSLDMQAAAACPAPEAD